VAGWQHALIDAITDGDDCCARSSGGNNREAALSVALSALDNILTASSCASLPSAFGNSLAAKIGGSHRTCHPIPKVLALAGCRSVSVNTPTCALSMSLPGMKSDSGGDSPTFSHPLMTNPLRVVA
jgi:hypothetical protein